MSYTLCNQCWRAPCACNSAAPGVGGVWPIQPAATEKRTGMKKKDPIFYIDIEAMPLTEGYVLTIGENSHAIGAADDMISFAKGELERRMRAAMFPPKGSDRSAFLDKQEGENMKEPKE